MSSDLGEGNPDKPKVDPKQHGSTLFVSNLPYSATSVDLQTLFSEIAPVRSAFVVTEHGTGTSKGVGYVSFSLKEGAESAFETISKNGLELVGRKLRVQWAESKKHQEKGEADGSVKQPKQKLPRAPAHHDPLAIRTVVISGLPLSLDSKVLWKKIRKYEGAEKVDFPITSVAAGEDHSTAHVLFSTPALAAQAVNKLHAHVYKGSLLSVTLKKRLDGLAKPLANLQKGKNASIGSAPNHASRLIVRNLPFDVTEQDLRAVFLPYGPIHEIHIPMDNRRTTDVEGSEQAENSASTRKLRTKGFAFVWMLSKKDAEKAIQECNGTVMRAGTAHTLISDKQKKKKERRLEMKKLKATAANKKGEGSDVESDEDMEDHEIATKRVIAVDWALSKDRWKEEQTKVEDHEMNGMSESDDDADNSDAGSGADEDRLGVHGGDDSDGSASESGDENEEEEEREKPQLPHPETGSTVFIRNIPFDATEDELRTLFRSFGPLRYARITKDPISGRSRGTGFACFWNKEDADRTVRQSELLNAETVGQSTVPKNNPFTLPSILTPDPSSSLAQSLVLHGRTLDVVTAVTREAAGKLKEENERARKKVDKRNMYLLKEGVILPNSPGADTLTPAEVERRTSSFNARRALLKSNPSLYISKTRLSVRQIPTFVTERMLRKLALHSMKSFNTEVKQGLRDPLSADDFADLPISKPGDADFAVEDNKNDEKNKSIGKKRGVRQAKIVRQADRIDPISGKGKSKGYGFVEMYKHSDALKSLRWTNNNAKVGELFSGVWWKEELEALLKTEQAKDENSRDDDRLKRLKEEIERLGDHDAKRKSKTTLIVEFSIENVEVMQRRNTKQKDNKEKAVKNSELAGVKKRKRELEIQAEDSGIHEKPPSKKRSALPQTEPIKSAKTPFTNPIGSIIGRKRKERKKGKKS